MCYRLKYLRSLARDSPVVSENFSWTARVGLAFSNPRAFNTMKM